MYTQCSWKFLDTSNLCQLFKRLSSFDLVIVYNVFLFLFFFIFFTSTFCPLKKFSLCLADTILLSPPTEVTHTLLQKIKNCNKRAESLRRDDESWRGFEKFNFLFSYLAHLHVHISWLYYILFFIYFYS